VTLIYDFSRYTKLYLLRSKDEAYNMFSWSRKSTKKKIKWVKSDRGG
jgi:hypothetical protein